MLFDGHAGYQMNLILSDGCRLNVKCTLSRDFRLMTKESKRLSDYLEVPLWDARGYRIGS